MNGGISLKDIITQINEIREINKQHKLVVFVGAGVSRNSGVCSWWELIREIAEKIGYSNCEKCPFNNTSSKDVCSNYTDNANCKNKYNFSTDDFLKIPQYFYNKFGEDEYVKFIQDKFSKQYIPNEINNLIIQIGPEHIITTNYDHLIEDVKHVNMSMYTIIKNDRDILEKQGNRYIIKMHGDLDNISDIVLKEDDYLKYSHTHEIIESYIKSLLFDKTFLFLGYSLNDNNLKLIMSYIDNYVKNNKINNRTSHYLVTNKIESNEIEYKYWSTKDIELVDLSTLNSTMKENTNCDSIASEQGKSLYTFLNYIKNDKLPYSNNKAEELKLSLINYAHKSFAFNETSYNTLIKMCHFKHPVKIISAAIHFFDEEEFELLKNVFEQNGDDIDIIKQCFLKAGIYAIQTNKKRGQFVSYKLVDSANEEDKLLELSLNNKYTEIIDKVNDYPNNLEKAYYYFLVYYNPNNYKDIMDSIKKDIESLNYHDLSDKDVLNITVYEYNNISMQLIYNKYNNENAHNKLTEILNYASNKSPAFEYIKNFYNDDSNIIYKLNKCLAKHEEYYMKKSTTFKMGGTIYGDLFDLQGVVYDYYLFYKKNYIMLDWFSNVKNVAAPYIKAILCTYYPDSYQFSLYDMGRTQVAPYPLSLLDIDLIVKHSDYKLFNSWIEHYKVFEIKIDEDIDIAELFCDFCVSMKTFWNIYWSNQLKVFVRLIALVELSEDEEHSILTTLIELIKIDESQNRGYISDNLLAVELFVKKHFDSNDLIYSELLSTLINKSFLDALYSDKNTYSNLINKLSNFSDKEIYIKCVEVINSYSDEKEKNNAVYIYHKILLKVDVEKWHKWILDNINNHSIDAIFTYLMEETLIYNDLCKQKFKNTLIKHSQNSLNMNNTIIKGITSYPDHKKETINRIIILHLVGRIKKLDDIDFLKEYMLENDYISFLFTPETFDYSKITIADYMWCNLIANDKYREKILQHKSEFWTEDDEKRIKLGFGDFFENKMAYKYLFD